MLWIFSTKVCSVYGFWTKPATSAAGEPVHSSLLRETRGDDHGHLRAYRLQFADRLRASH
jgi:hypothetical protein